MDNPSIEVRNLTTGYRNGKGEVTVTQNVDASLYPGELTCLLGPNGAGKSTLLRTLTAFQPMVSGEIKVMGRPLDEYSAVELAKVISVVLTDKPSVNNMTVADMVGLGRGPYTGFWGRMDDKDREVVDHSLELVGIEALKNRNVHTLSDGERQKVMIAKSLAQETPVIFLDEPTAFLDYPSKVEIMQLLRRLAAEKGKTVFMSTHDLELALQIADRIWLLDKTRGVRIGIPEDLAAEGAIGRYFDREGVCFDVETGMFRINNPVRGAVHFTGSGPRAALLLKALKRRGYTVSDDAGTEVSAISDTYLLNGSPHATMESLLRELETTAMPS